MQEVNEFCFFQGWGVMDKCLPLFGPWFSHQSIGGSWTEWPWKPLQFRGVAPGCDSGWFGEAEVRVCACVLSGGGLCAGSCLGGCACMSVFWSASACLWRPWALACLHVLHSSPLWECVWESVWAWVGTWYRLIPRAIKHLPGVVYGNMFFIISIYFEVGEISFVQYYEEIKVFGVTDFQYLASIFLLPDSYLNRILTMQNITLHVAMTTNVAVESPSSGEMYQITCKPQW